MMKRNLFAMLTLTVIAFPALAQMTGSVSGSVMSADSIPLEGARVVLHGGSHGGGMGDYQTWTDGRGEFSLSDVAVGDYEARAMLSGYGHDEADIQIEANENTEVNFVLEGHGGGGHDGGHGHHNLEEVSLHGWTIIEENEWMDHYYLDEDNDGTAEYLLCFGPPWYEPPSGAQRPENGEEIDIVGGLMDMMMEPPLVIVWEMNGEVWFEPETSGHHGGHGGDWHDGHGCDYEDPVLVEAEGWAIVEEHGGMHELYWLDENDDDSPEFRLSFGAPDYEPGSGATRPLDDDWVEIVGGLIEGCPVAPTIVVYEINGLFWREPGDTTGLGGPQLSTENLEEITTLPLHHLVIEAYPNPFNPETTIRFTVPSAGYVKVAVYDVLGGEVSVLHDGLLGVGAHIPGFLTHPIGHPASTSSRLKRRETALRSALR